MQQGQLPGDLGGRGSGGRQQHNASALHHAPFGLVAAHLESQRLFFLGVQSNHRCRSCHTDILQLKALLSQVSTRPTV